MMTFKLVTINIDNLINKLLLDLFDGYNLSGIFTEQCCYIDLYMTDVLRQEDIASLFLY